MADLLGVVGVLAGVIAIVGGAETFAEHLGAAAARLGVSAFALALLLAGAEPEELATAIAAAVRGAPAIALGDVIGANVAVCLVALGVGAVIAPLPFGPRVRRYALLGLPVALVAVAIAWDGHVGRIEGALLVALYVAYVASIWIAERHPPALGEVGELEEAEEEAEAEAARGIRRRVGRELTMVVAGVAVMAVGATVLVESVIAITKVEREQSVLGITLVGFATAFELVVLGCSASRRGASEAVVAGVVGSYAYNVTMTLGAAAVVRPLVIADASLLRGPWLAMLGALVLVLALGWQRRRLGPTAGVLLLALYPVFVLLVALR